MHHARLAFSPRLRRTLAVLEAAEGRWLSSRTLLRRANIVAVSAVVSELRENGAAIECEQRVNAAGIRRWFYRLVAAPEGWRTEIGEGRDA